MLSFGFRGTCLKFSEEFPGKLHLRAFSDPCRAILGGSGELSMMGSDWTRRKALSDEKVRVRGKPGAASYMAAKAKKRLCCVGNRRTCTAVRWLRNQKF